MALYDDIKQKTDTFQEVEKKRWFGSFGRGKRNRQFLKSVDEMMAKDAEAHTSEDTLELGLSILGTSFWKNDNYVNDTANTYGRHYSNIRQQSFVSLYDNNNNKKLHLAMGYPSMVFRVHPKLAVEEKPIGKSSVAKWMKEVRENTGTGTFKLEATRPILPMHPQTERVSRSRTFQLND